MANEHYLGNSEDFQFILETPYKFLINSPEGIFFNGENVVEAHGTANLSLGSVVVNDSRVTADSEIFLTAQNGTLNLGAINVSARTPGTSFTITSSNVLDARKVAWKFRV